MSDKNKPLASMPKPINLDAPQMPEGYEEKKRARGMMPEFDSAPIGMPGRRGFDPDERGLDAHRSAQRDFGATPHPERPYSGEPRRRLPPPPPQIRPGDMPRKRKPQRPRKNREPSLFSRFLKIKINTVVLSIVGWAVAAIALVAITVWFVTNLFEYNAFAVYIDGVHIGYIPIDEDLTSEDFHNYAVMSLSASRAGAQVVVEQRVTIEPARASNADRSTRNEIFGRLNRNYFDYTIAAIAIYVDGNFEALMRTQTDLTNLKFRLQERWFNENTNRELTEFVDGWEERVIFVDPDETEFHSPEQAFWALDRTTMHMYRYTVRSGDNLERIAVRFGTEVHRIMGDNNLTTVNIWPYDILYIYTSRPLLSVRTFDDIATPEPIEMPVETIDNPNLPAAVTNVIQEGAPGQQISIKRIIRVDGVEVGYELLDAEVIIEPIPHIVEVGTGPPAQVTR